MKIAYDGSGLTLPRTGVGNYIEQLLTQLVQNPSADEYWLLAHRHEYLDAWVDPRRNIHRAPVQFPNRLLWMQVLLPTALRRLRPDVTHFTNFVAPLFHSHNLVVTVHDIYLVKHPKFCSPRQRVLLRPLIAPTARRARMVITVSAASRREIIQTLRIEPERVRVIHEAAAPRFFANGDAATEERRRALYGWDDSARNLLYVGTLEPRKNVARLISAVQLLHARGTRVHLWLVGQSGWNSQAIRQRVQALGLERFVHLTGYLPGQDLSAFYRGCDVFVCPSLYEGFGLPILEAMACGAPTVLSEIPTFLEIADGAAVYFDPHSEASVAETIQCVLDDADCREALSARSRVRAAEFSWARTARETYAVYREVANAKDIGRRSIN